MGLRRLALGLIFIWILCVQTNVAHADTNDAVVQRKRDLKTDVSYNISDEDIGAGIIANLQDRVVQQEKKLIAEIELLNARFDSLSDVCHTDPCRNNGKCGDNRFTCSCPSGFTGSTCEINVDECQSNPCRNNGTCSDGINIFTCACPSGFHGHNCNNSFSHRDVMMCNDTVIYHGQQGSLCSPGYPLGYGNNRDCNVTIIQPADVANQTLELTALAFSTETHDYLKIYYGDGGGYQRFNGPRKHWRHPMPIGQTLSYHTTTGRLRVRFTSDGSITYPGFNITYLVYGL